MTDAPSHVIPDATCPMCGYTSDRASPANTADSAPPVGGDVTICFGCGTILIFREDLSMRLPLIEEAEDLCENHPETMAELAQVQQGIYRMRREG